MTFSWLTFALLVLIAVATFGVTEFLAARWTTWRRYFVLRDWGKLRQLKLTPGRLARPDLPPRVGRIEPPLRVRWQFSDGRMTILRLQRDGTTHNLLLIPILLDWPATALRAAMRTNCLLDHLGLFNYPSIYGVERFTLHGVDPPAARRLNECAIRGLLPADLSLLLEGRCMVIDFSTRPFDPIELDRVIALAEQLSAATPTSTDSAGVV